MTYYLTLRVEILNSEEGDDDDDEEDFEAQAASMSEEQVEELRGVCIQTLEQMPMDEEQRVGEFCVLSRCRLCLSFIHLNNFGQKYEKHTNSAFSNTTSKKYDKSRL